MASRTIGQITVEFGLDASRFQAGIAQVQATAAAAGPKVAAALAPVTGPNLATAASGAVLPPWTAATAAAQVKAALGLPQAQAQIDALNAKLAQLPPTMNQAAGAAQNLGGHMRSIGSAFALGASAATALSVLGEIGKAAADVEQGQVRLKTAVEAAGGSWGQYRGALDAAISKSKAMGFAEKDAAESLSLLVAQTGSVDEALRRQALAMDLSRGANIDLVTAARLVGKVTDDNISVLNRMGFAVKKGSTEQEALASIQARVAGQAEAQSNTMAAAAERVKSTVTDVLAGLGSVLATAAPTLMAVATAFNELGLRAIFSAGGIAGFGEAMRLAGARAGGLAIALAPIAALAAAAAAGIGLAVGAVTVLGRVGGEGSEAKKMGETLEQIGAIVGKIGVGGLFGALVGELYGVGKQTEATAGAMAGGSTSAGIYADAVGGVSDKLRELGTTTGQAAFKSINDQVLALVGNTATAKTALAEIQDLMNGVAGLTASAKLDVFVGNVRASAIKGFSAELDSMQALRDSAAREGQNVARFWEDEANRKADFAKSLRDTVARESESIAKFWSDEARRRADFTVSMAERAKPVIETIDQLNKDLGTGFDQRRRALQAEAKKAQFDAETAVLQRKEDERIAQLTPPTHEGSQRMQEQEDKRVARLRPPETPELDKITKLYGSMAGFDEAIRRTRENVEKETAIFDKLVNDWRADIDEAAKIADRRALYQGSSGVATTAADKREDQQIKDRAALFANQGGSDAVGIDVPGAAADARSAAAFSELLTGIGEWKDSVGASIDQFGRDLKTWTENPPKAVHEISGTVDITNSDGSIARANQEELAKQFGDFIQGILSSAQAKLNAGQSDAAGNAILA